MQVEKTNEQVFFFQNAEYSFVSALSPEVWTYLLEFLGNLEALSLWITGNTLIRMRLGSQSGWKRLKFSGEFVLPHLQKWPAWLLPQLHGLSILHISPRNSACLLPLLRPSLQDIMELPKSLTDLELNFVDGIRDEFIPHLPPGLTRLSLPLNRSISHRGLEKLNPKITILELWSNMILNDISRLPSNLESYSACCEAFSPTQSNIFLQLPLQLIELTLVSTKTKNPTWNMDHLNLSSVHQYLSSLYISPIDIGTIIPRKLSLPPQLTSLELIGNPRIEEECLTALPRTLTLLKLIFKPSTVYLRWTNKGIKMLPRSLTHLEVMPDEKQKFGVHWPIIRADTTLTPECLSYMPNGLKTLRLLQLIPPTTLDMSNFMNGTVVNRSFAIKALQTELDQYSHLLPASITDLYLLLFWNNISIFPSIDSLPTSLITFEFGSTFLGDIEDCLDNDHNSIMKAPLPTKEHQNGNPSSSSQSLPLPNSSSQSSNMDHISPDNYLTSAQNSTFRPKNVILPKNFAHISNAYSGFNWPRISPFRVATSLEKTFSQWLLQFPPSGLQHLSLVWCENYIFPIPSTLTSLILISTYKFDDSYILSFPATLTMLHLKNHNSELTDECIPALPHDLIILSLPSKNKIRGDIYPWPKRIQCLELGPSDISDYRPQFPYWTTQLILYSESITDSSFSIGIPPFLTQLTLTNCQMLTGKCLPYLPDALTSLTAPKLELEDDDIVNLPKSLRFLDLRASGSFLTWKSAGDFPPLLQDLRILAPLYTNDAISRLPRSITHLLLPNARMIDNTTLMDCFWPALKAWKVGFVQGRR
jgi:hypothetical protein